MPGSGIHSTPSHVGATEWRKEMERDIFCIHPSSSSSTSNIPGLLVSVSLVSAFMQDTVGPSQVHGQAQDCKRSAQNEEQRKIPAPEWKKTPTRNQTLNPESGNPLGQDPFLARQASILSTMYSQSSWSFLHFLICISDDHHPKKLSDFKSLSQGLLSGESK